MTTDLITLEQLAEARTRLLDLPPSPMIRVDEKLWLKLENLQLTGSFKVRGFLNAVRSLDEQGRSSGIITSSAGNAALAAAYAARRMGVGCTVIMFDTAPEPKRQGVERLGVEMLLWPRAKVIEWLSDRDRPTMGRRFIHPLADDALIAGNGTLGLEILDQVPEVERIVAAVGGGGLVTGIASAVRATRGDVDIVGVQSSGYPLWPRTMRDGTPPKLVPDTIADGTLAPYHAGMEARLRQAVDRWLEVPERAVRSAIAELALQHKLVAEGAGALAYAATRIEPPTVPTVAIVSGGNIAHRLLADLIAESRSNG